MTQLNGQLTPKEAIERLKEGNRRFLSGESSMAPLLDKAKMKELAEKGQRPFAIVLTCSDSRSPAELIFDQGFGDLFVIRVAGNVVAPSLLASIEFAAANFGTPVVLVLGHTQCGAIKATFGNVKNPRETVPSSNLYELIGRIRPAVEITVFEKEGKVSEPDLLNLAAKQNVMRSMQLIMEQSQIVRDLVEAGQLRIEGAMLNISTGKVEYVENANGEPS